MQDHNVSYVTNSVCLTAQKELKIEFRTAHARKSADKNLWRPIFSMLNRLCLKSNNSLYIYCQRDQTIVKRRKLSLLTLNEGDFPDTKLVHDKIGDNSTMH
jgi:hypothetical protein